MTFDFQTVFFPARLFTPEGQFRPEMLALFFERYTDSESGLSTVHWDDTAHTQQRNASIYDRSIRPLPVIESGVIIGYKIRCGWHPQFIADVRRDPQPEPELFEGIEIVDNSHD